MGKQTVISRARAYLWRNRAVIAKFFAVGLTSRLIQTVLLWAITEQFGVHYVVSSLIAVGVVFVFGYFANKYWAFRK